MMLNSNKLSEGQSRLQSIDILRGLVMVIMALDHVREFFSYTSYRATDLTQASVLLFSTRWITHLCAPTFVFLSGVSIHLYFIRIGDRKKTSIYLLTRGVWLILVEIFIISFILTQGYQLTVLEVIWAIASSMIFLAGLIWLPRWFQIALSLILIAGHNAIPIITEVSSSNMIPAFLHNIPFFITNPPILVAYTIVPWVAVMLLGFAIGPWFTSPQKERDTFLLRAGFSALICFMILRLSNIYGDPSVWEFQERGPVYTFLSFLNVTKTPPSLLFLSVTIGIACFLLVLVNKFSDKVQQLLIVYGRVPFFYFILHLAAISATSYLWTYLSFGKAINLSFTSPKDWPADYVPNLGRAYLVWIILVVVIYFPCSWYGRYKAKNKSWWGSYL